MAAKSIAVDCRLSASVVAGGEPLSRQSGNCAATAWWPSQVTSSDQQSVPQLVPKHPPGAAWYLQGSAGDVLFLCRVSRHYPAGMVDLSLNGVSVVCLAQNSSRRAPRNLTLVVQ